MEKSFNQISDRIFSKLRTGEHLTISLRGENSQFIRFNDARVRQMGLVEDGTLVLELIFDNRTCSGGITFRNNFDEDWELVQTELNRLREEIIQLPEDPFIVLPENTGYSRKIQHTNGLGLDKAVDTLVPPMIGFDLVGIWMSGRIYRGNANSTGQRHWFETDTYSLDCSLITPDHKMVKGTFAGTDWDKPNYETFITDLKNKLELMNRKPVKVEPGEYRTWFAPAAVSDFIRIFSWNGISEAAIQQGNSALVKMRNEGKNLSPLFNLAEDFRSGLVPRFNERGEMAPEYIPLISNGKLENTLVSSRTAKEYDKETNYASGEEYLRSPVMAPGDLDEKNVLKELETGLYLSNLHYLNWSDNIGGRITGLTRYACFWVENGEIVSPIETMRFDDTIYRFFGSELEAVGKNKKFIPEVETYEGRELGGVTCPGILVNSFTLTL